MSAGNEEASQLKAGHPPAVKAGGMRITQHKEHKSGAAASKDAAAAKDATTVVGDVTAALSGPSNVPTDSAVAVKAAAEYAHVAAQVAHTPKPPAAHQHKPQVNIQQPRK